MKIDSDIDVTGKACPLPLIALAKEIGGLSPGRTVRITGNDPIFEKSIEEFCRERGHEILETLRDGRKVALVIKV